MKNAALKLGVILVIILIANKMTYSQGYCYPDQSPTYWKIDEALYGSRLLSSCSPEAYYSCHGFMMSYFEILESSNCPKPSWINSVPTPYLCPNPFGRIDALTWQNSGRYIQVCQESEANIAYYQFIGANHSAVKTVTNGR